MGACCVRSCVVAGIVAIAATSQASEQASKRRSFIAEDYSRKTISVCDQAYFRSCLLVCFVRVSLAATATAADWPTDRHDVTRGSVSPEQLALPLSER